MPITIGPRVGSDQVGIRAYVYGHLGVHKVVLSGVSYRGVKCTTL